MQILALACAPSVAIADDSGFLGRIGSAQQEAKVHGHDYRLLAWPGITGTWGGYRKALDDNGITIDALYTGEFVQIADGVINKRDSVYHDNLDLTLTLDTEKSRLWPGGTLFIHGLYNHGGDPSADSIGDLQTASNIEAPNQFIIQELWYEQSFARDTASLLFGLYDLNSEFYVSDYGSLFINSSFGIGPEVSANVPASLFPKAGGAIRLRIKPMDNFYLQTAVFDGDPATRKIRSAEGKMVIAESGINSASGSYKFGYWIHTANKVFINQTFANDYGVYAIADQELVHLDGDSAIGAFVQWGWVPGTRNEVTGYVGGGLHMHGLIPGRDEDDLGIAVAVAATHAASETTWELTYRMVVAPWLSVQSSFQNIRHPGGDPAAKAVKVGLFRFEVTL